LTKRDEIRLLPPRLLPLSSQRRQAAVRLLSELVLEETLRERPVDGSSADGGGGVVPFPARLSTARSAA
jgi:hypothetical protein